MNSMGNFHGNKALLGTILLLFITMTGAAAEPSGSDKPNLPDLDVLFIEQWPAYQGYLFAYL